jgi:hypothetical protein
MGNHCGAAFMTSSLDVEPARGPPRDGKRSRTLPPAHAAAGFIAEARSRLDPTTAAVLEKEAATLAQLASGRAAAAR